MTNVADLSRYRTMLRAGTTGGALAEPEATATSEDLDLSTFGISNRLESTSEQLHGVVRRHLGDRAELHEIVDEIIKQGGTALEVVADDDQERLAQDRQIQVGLEVIVRTDGSRPSFMIRNGAVDLTTSPVGSWQDCLDQSRPDLEPALACVGRIDLPGAPLGFQGTGFLIHENLILTNRHVLQVVADETMPGNWTIKRGAAIDFGHEFRANKSYPRRALKRVLFCGGQAINFTGPIDHKRLDLALFELEPAAPADRPNSVLAVDLAPDWASDGTTIFIVGYPGPPPLHAHPPTLLERLFQATYGCKRLAPGLTMASNAHVVELWTVTHDATTLGGNSGSIILVAGREQVAAGLHYGGRSAPPRENWGHILGQVLDQSGANSNTTLREHFAQFGVDLVDRAVG